MFVRDAELRGFALRVTQGRKSFILEKRIRGRMRRLTIGPYGPLTVDQAHTLAQAHVGAIAQGTDPAQMPAPKPEAVLGPHSHQGGDSGCALS